jgi:hypothetical protein
MSQDLPRHGCKTANWQEAENARGKSPEATNIPLADALHGLWFHQTPSSIQRPRLHHRPLFAMPPYPLARHRASPGGADLMAGRRLVLAAGSL